MSRYKITVHYDGTNYFGWQMQSHKRTIQGEIETALLPLNDNETVKIVGAGRTDTGVHALGQVAHFDLDTKLNVTQLLKALNARLPNDIRILAANLTEDEFHARFSAKRRYYRYQCYIGDNILFKNQSWFISEIDVATLNEFANLIEGSFDFLSFSKINKELKNTICDIYESKWYKSENMLIFNVCGNRFLHHMVRYLVGTMVAGVQGKISLDYFRDLLNNPQKNVKIFKAPPEGLILVKIDYDK